MVAATVRHHPRHLVAPLQTTLDRVQSSSRLNIMTTIMMIEKVTLWNLEWSSFLEHLCFEEKLLASHFIQSGAGQHLKVRDSQNSPSLSIVSTSIQNAHEFGRSHQNYHHLSLMDRDSYLLIINCCTTMLKRSTSILWMELGQRLWPHQILSGVEKLWFTYHNHSQDINLSLMD